MKYALSQHVRLHHDEASDNHYLFNIDSGAQYRLNRMGLAICVMLEEGKNRNDIAKLIAEKLSIDFKLSKKDIGEFFDFLLANKLIHI